jgi:maltose alpha-D-glucosyltransferase/alpha-amylase
MNEKKDLDINPTWYKDAVIYQLHVKSFYDGKADGIGDFVGLTKKLDYLESLGINTIWLLPFYPSPLRDDGYDISDYYGINPSYGTMDDFREFLEEAHKREIKVITELVLNHTSDQHEWFKKSRESAPGSYWRNFYVWSDTKDRYNEARIIFKDFETSNWTWDPIAKAFFWHRFYSHQPDLNFENQNVHKALFKAIDFWLSMGVDGMRLDAVPYLYEQEGTNCENLPQTFAFLKKLRAHVEEYFPGRMLLAEANQWPEDAVAYFGNGDMCHMAFHFPLMPRMFMALQKEDRFPIIDILEQTPAIPENAQWAIFLRNHDELTLEMVSEEERDFMYRSYARALSSRINLGIRRRLAPLLQNSRRRIELLNILLLSLPGAPVIYYGDEIGMGDNHFLGDRNGVRTPMQWSPDRNAGFSQVNPQQLFLPVIIDPEYHYQSINVENEERNLSSLLWWMRRAIAMRRTYQAFSRGSMEIVKSSNASVLSFIRKLDDEVILIVVNLSRFSQSSFLDLGAYVGTTPIDIFSGNRFSRISQLPYQMTLGFHDYFWMALKADHHADPRTESYALPDFEVGKRWLDIFDGASGRKFSTEILPAYLEQRTTSGCQSKKIQQTVILDRIPVKHDLFTAIILFVKVRYADSKGDIVMLPFTLEAEEHATAVIGEDKGLILGLVNGGSGGIIYDCAYHPQFLKTLFDIVKNRRSVKGQCGALKGEYSTKVYGQSTTDVSFSRLVKAGRRNTCAVFEDKLFVKLFRRLDEGDNPEIELHRRLAEQGDKLVTAYVGSLSYKGESNVSYDIGVYSDYFDHSRTLWHFAQDAVSQYFEETLANFADRSTGTVSPSVPIQHSPTGALFEKKVRMIGELTAKMHSDLVEQKNEQFRAEPFSAHYQRSLYQSFRGLTHRVFSRVEEALDSVTKIQADELRKIISLKNEILTFVFATLRSRISAVRMRIHGDYHLGQIMFMDEQYRICDFEGMSSHPLGERRIKRSPLRDIASMVHSFYSTAHYALMNNVQIQSKDRERLLPQANIWAANMRDVFVRTYFDATKGASINALSFTDAQSLLNILLLEHSIVDLDLALNDNLGHINTASRCLTHYLQVLSILTENTSAVAFQNTSMLGVEV